MASVLRIHHLKLLGVRPASTSASISSAATALSLIRSQPSHYIIASIVGHRHLLAPRDLLTVPRLKDVRIGDRLALSEIHELGSRDYTLRGKPVLPPHVVKVEATVVEHTKGNMERIVKFKKRKHYKKTITHKQTYTRLRIGPFDLGKEEVQTSQSVS